MLSSLNTYWGDCLCPELRVLVGNAWNQKISIKTSMLTVLTVVVHSTNINATVSKIKHSQFQKLVSTKHLYVHDAKKVKYTLGVRKNIRKSFLLDG